jgi:hypothetical protein
MVDRLWHETNTIGRLEGESAMVLTAWCWFTAVVLVVSAVVHLSTFFGANLLALWPGVWWLHVAIPVAFGMSIYYVRRAGGKDQMTDGVPPWLSTLACVLFFYGLVNFAIFMIRAESGLEERDGKYVKMDRGRVLREVDKAEYEWQEVLVVRGFSGHWMLFSSAALMLLAGTARRRPNPTGGPSMPAEPSGIQHPAPGALG